MKKSLALVLTLICVVVLFVGCSKESTYKPIDVKNVSILISNISSTGATITIKDTNKEPYSYKEWYKIEKENDGKWYEIETIINDYKFDDIGYIPNKNGEIKFTVDWEQLYGKLPSGDYRLLKRIDSQYISIEFSIEATEQ